MKYEIKKKKKQRNSASKKQNTSIVYDTRDFKKHPFCADKKNTLFSAMSSETIYI